MKLLTVMSVVYCISFAKAKTSWVPQEYKKHLNLRTFLTTTGGIYTVLATSETRRRLCKVDYDINVTDTQVYFNRSYTPGQEGPSAESLVGTFFGELEEPTIMLLKTTDGADRGAEQLVHQDDEHKCGILFAVRKQIFANQWYDSCELRVNSAHSPPITARECIESFIRICDPEHIVAQTVWPTFCVYIVSSPTGVKSAVRSKYIRQLYKTANT
uniref:Putative lipocalin n=1 Tax=Rhipicephalus microplus TaxID=6941 RepID=A0A6G5A6D9_RHIMP